MGSSLLARVGFALLLVGLLPLAVVAYRLTRLNQQAMETQVLQTHSVAAATAAERTRSLLTSLRRTAETMARSRAVVEDPRSPDAQELLASALGAEPLAVALAVWNAEGAEVVRVQHKDRAVTVSALLATAPGEERVTAVRDGAQVWLRLSAPIEGERGFVEVVTGDEALRDIVHPPQMMDEAILALGGLGDLVVAASDRSPSLAAYPPRLVDLARAQKLAGGAGRFLTPGGQRTLGAFAPVPETTWFVLSLQPAHLAEAVSVRMSREATLAVAGSLVLCGLLAAGAWRSVVKPIRELAQAQRRVAGLSGSSGRNEVESLRASFEALEAGIRDQARLSRVFLGRYQVLELIGSGGMGTVFRGWDPKLERSVALKTVRVGETRTGGGDSSGSLLREAVTIARLNHPNIVQVYDVEDAAGVAFVAMELVEGEGLASYLRRRHVLGPSEAVPIAAGIAAGLAAAHAGGVVHRDVKPGNVLLARDGGVKVTDFGIAELRTKAVDAPGKLFGSPGFIPPEALRGEAWGPSGDLFSLGVVLYQCLSGSRPFQGKDLQAVLRSTLRETPQPIGERVLGLPLALELLVDGLLSKDPARRGTAASVAETLERLGAQRGWRFSGIASEVEAETAPSGAAEGGAASTGAASSGGRGAG